MSLDQTIIDLYDEYTHKPLERRVFLERLTRLAGGAAAVPAMLAVLEPGYARAQQVSADDKRIETRRISFNVGGVALSGLLARPVGVAKAPGLLVIHENRGLNPHIEDVTRRAAVAGFQALGIDFLHPLGGTPTDADQARDQIGKLPLATAIAQGRAALTFLKQAPDGNGKAGAVGFCWGGGIVNTLATDAPELNAGVVLYGRAPQLSEVPRIKAPLLLHYAALDTRINEGLPPYEAALKAASARYTVQMYPGVNHAFHNDTAGERYDKAAAELAWSRTVEFLKTELAAKGA